MFIKHDKNMNLTFCPIKRLDRKDTLNHCKDYDDTKSDNSF